MKRAIWAALVAGFVLTGCQTQPGTVTDVHMGVTAKHSGMTMVHSGLFDSMWVVALSGTRGNVTKYGLGTRYLSTGQGWAFFREAWSYGRKLDYKPGKEQLTGCAGGCSMIEEGGIRMTKAEFEAAARNGLEFKLVGQNRELVVKVPAKVFQAALSAK